MTASTACYLNEFTRAETRVQVTLVAIAIASMSIDYSWSVALETPNSRKEHEPCFRSSKFVLSREVKKNLFKDFVKNYTFQKFYTNPL
jgi:hypothetical protein